MKPTRFELSKARFFSVKEKLLVVLSICSYIPYLTYKIIKDDPFSTDSVIISFVVLMMLASFYLFKVYYSRIKFFKIYVEFSGNHLSYQLSNFDKDNIVVYKDIESISIKASEILLETDEGNSKLKLNVFSTKEIHRIKLYFKNLRDELAIPKK